jgi:hypothetical protein
MCGASNAAGETGTEPEPIRLDYTAPGGCPSRDAFVERLRARTTRFREAGERDAPRVFTVEIDAQGDAAKGRLSVRSRDGSSASREVRASTCEQVGAALVLIVAVAIDPLALVGTAPETNAPEPPPVAPVRPRDVASPIQALRAPHLRAAFGLRWDEVSGVTPMLRPVLRPWIEVASERRGTLVPVLRLSFAWTRNAHVAATSGGAEFSWYVGRVEACPVRIGSESASLTPCATLDVGALRVIGQDAPTSTSRTRPWASAGLSARAAARLVGWAFAEIEAGTAAPWTRDRWLLADGFELHAAPVVTFWMGAGLGCHFP